MDTSQIKRFAIEARNILKQGVINRIAAFGFNDKGEVEERNKPQRLQGNTLFMGQLYDENFYGKWMALYNRVQTKGIKEVYEEAAYTWFNRLMAIRIMEKNGFTEPVLAFDDDRFRIPRIVSNARAGQFSVDASDREKLSELLMDDTKTTEQFTLLITSFCHTNPIINNCFGGVSDYTEILLPTNILSEGGFVDLLNHTAFITDDDYRQSELIGWLYQFYISEKKDEVFASFKGGKKAGAEDIPAATQIFTPNWIVKYMVQNTVGRIFLDNNPDSDLKGKWKYLVEPSTPTPDDCIFHYDDPKELTMADLGCGSGHILNEGFDILYDIYIEEGYSRKQAVENIFKYNLTGVDLDTRAKQLATFALMMKACQKDDSFLDCHVMPNVLDMPDVDRYSFIEADGHFCCAYSLEWDYEQKEKIHLELVRAFELLKQAHNLGSIMKFDLSNFTKKYIKRCVELYEEDPKFPNPFATLIHAYKLILALTQKYASLVMNPPYMGSGNMNAELSLYVATNYPEGKADLMTVFMEKAWGSMLPLGYFAMINLPSWMFIASFIELRKTLVNNFQIESLLHLGRGIFGSDFGTVAFVVKNTIPNNSGIYRRLFKEHVQVRSVEQIQHLFLEKQYGRYVTCQSIFNHIKGTPIGYWATPQIIKAFSGKLLSSFGVTRKGMYTGCNALYVRSWTEVSDTKVGFHYTVDTYKESGKKWYPYANGGEFRKWYGNFNDVVLWENDGEELKAARNSKGKMQAGCFNVDYIFKEGIFWSSISAKQYSMKYLPQGHLFSSASNAWFPYDLETIEYILANVNSKVSREIMNILNPTLNYNAGDIINIPIIIENKPIIESFTKENISISKQDWDAHETSWDFETNELLKIDDDTYHSFTDAHEDEIRERYGRIDGDGYLLEALVECYKEKWEENFHQLHANEEELNRQFIEIYGLQDELTPDVPLDEITILQQGEISIEDD
ncbi:MAG: BREX-1 system adenine-specific DNA-methyltransferase PglX [Bacteroidales bacterium]|nr:BREX-1 system adenine-specific DNA-methyltransferase PglX [Bacteroidales bacterium]